MKATNVNECVAQGAAAWSEREIHEKIMKKLEGVYGHMAYCQCDYGHGEYWKVEHLPDDDLLEIMQRGNHYEILYMIQRYGQSAPPVPHSRNCAACHGGPTTAHILPDKIQEMIALRNNRKEIDTYLSFQGFGECGQNVILDRNDHEELMRVISRHGFLPPQQRRLKESGDKEAFLLHISRHGLASELLDEMFDRLEAGGSTDEYYEFIERHELPVPHQRRMLKTVKTPEFKAYVRRYGLWKDVHGDLVDCRSEDEIFIYLKIHPYLSKEGEHKLAQLKSHRLNMLYVTTRPETEYDKIDNFWAELLRVRPLDYQALSSCFLKLDYTPKWSYHQLPEQETEDADMDLMRTGSHEDVMKRVVLGHLSRKPLAQLFFRNNPEEFEAYLDARER